MRQREEKEKIQNGIKEEDKSQNGIKENDKSQNGNKEEDKSQNGIKENDKSHNGIKEEDKSQNGIKEEDKSPNGIKNEDTSQTGLEEKKNEMPNNGNHMDVSDTKEISNEEIEPVENKSLELKPSEKVVFLISHTRALDYISFSKEIKKFAGRPRTFLMIMTLTITT